METAKDPEEGGLPARDGRSIPYRLQRSQQSPGRGAFLLLHGLGVDKDEYQGFYRTMSDLLSQAGFDVLRIDFPAHGESTAGEGAFSVINCVADAIIAAAFAIETASTRALNIFGTSFGAGPAVVTASFFSSVVNSVTLLAPALTYRDLYISPRYAERKAQYQHFYERALLRGESIAVGGGVRLDWRNAVEFDVVSFEHHLRAIATRTAIVHGAADSMVPSELSREIAQRLPEIALTIIAGMDHGFMDHEDEGGLSDASQRNLRTIVEIALR